jgi:hypothetical protein
MGKIYGDIEHAHKAVKAMKLRAYNYARESKMPYDLRIDDFFIPSHCPILGLPLVFKGGDNAPTFQRIDRNKGYIRGNFVIISRRASVIIHNILRPDVLTVCNYIARNGLIL